MAITAATVTTAGSTSWLCPPGVTSVQAQVWGGGGGGGGTNTSQGGGGGGGGAYAIGSAVSVTAGGGYAIVVGGGGTASATGAGGAGTASWWGTTGGSVFAAAGTGGPRGTASVGGAGGAVAACVGDLKFAGGTGFANAGTWGGGGGGGAGTTGAGGNSAGSAGGAAGGGGGGAGGSATAIGTAPGGGGGGRRTTTTAKAGAVGKIIYQYTTPKVEYLTDNFDDNSIDAKKWTTSLVNSGLATEANSQMNLVPNPSTPNTEANLISLSTYDLTASAAFVKVPQIAAQNCETSFMLAIDTANYIRFIHHPGGTLEAEYQLASSYTTIGSITYDAVNTPWWRIRESAGTTYCDYGADGLSWTSMGSVANPITITALKPQFQIWDGSSDATPGTAIFDNFNIAPSVSSGVMKGTFMLMGVGY